MKTTSSALPSTPATTVRTDWLIVSPVVNALERMTVPMVSPSVISTAKPGRRGTLRQASRGNSGLRQAATPNTTTTAPVSSSSPISSESCETPNRLLTQATEVRPTSRFSSQVALEYFAFDPPVAHAHDTTRVRRDLPRVGDQNER